MLPICLSAADLSTPPRFATRQRAAAALIAALLAALVSCEAVRREPLLSVGTSGDYAPFSTESAGDLRGLDVDIAHRFAADEGYRLELPRFAWPGLDEHIERGDFDVAMSGVTMRPERALAGRYTRPYATSGAVALIRSADADRFPDRSALGRPGVRLAVNAGGHLERVARRFFPGATIEPVSDNRSLPSRLLAGNADVVLTDSAEARAWQRTDLLRIGPFTSDHKAFLLPPDRVELSVRLDAWLVAREADGWLAARRSRWLGDEHAVDSAAAAREALVALVELRTSLMPLVAAAKQGEGLPIEDRAQEERVIDRIRSQSGPDREHVAGVYRVLIEIAKAAQRHAPADAPAASLARLRDAIGRIDEQLVRELRRLPGTDASTWAAFLDRNLDIPGVDASLRIRLAAALAEASSPVR